MTMTRRARAQYDTWKIGPDKAKELLENNGVNRRLRPHLVDSYAEDMRQGLWNEDTADLIKISKTGRLLDGQHRLSAIIEADTIMELDVATGLDDKAQRVMDQGSGRTASDVLGMEGYSNTAIAGGVARWVMLGGEPGPHLEMALKRKASTARILRTVQENPDVALAASKYSAFKNHVPGSPTAICYSWLWMHRLDVTDCDYFWTGMVDMNFKPNKDPRRAVLRALQRMDREEGIGTASKDKLYATVSVLTRGWNAWRTGEEIDTLALRGKFKKIVPPVRPV
jgi:hypothetical protein